MSIDCPCSVNLDCLSPVNLVNFRRLINSYLLKGINGLFTSANMHPLNFSMETFYSEIYEILGIPLYSYSVYMKRDVVQGFPQGEE